MSLLFAKKRAEPMRFSSRAEAFAYMLSYQIEDKGLDPMDAAQKANEFADIMAKNMGLPQAIVPTPEGIDKYIAMAEKLGDYCDKHPKAIEILTGAITFVAGIATGKRVEQTQEPLIKVDPIDFTKID